MKDDPRRYLAVHSGGFSEPSPRDGEPGVGQVPGDLVVELGTYRIRHSDDLLLFLQYVQPGDLVQITVYRPVQLRSGRWIREKQAGQLVAR